MIDPNLIFEKNNNSISYFSFNNKTKKKELKKYIPEKFINNETLNLPNISENQVLRHYINLSNKNFGIDTGFYPLGSCTMKYNPKINEKIAGNSSFINSHPYSDNNRIQGNFEILFECKNALLEITGMDDLTFAPCAGAHGELTGLYIIRAYFNYKNEKREYILIPDSAHGTNPASASMAGFKTSTIKSDQNGFIDINDLKKKVNKNIAGFMITNPNTLGLFEKNIDEIVNICKEHDIQLYYDGANFNAFLGITRPGDMGFDIVHINLHKTFSTPHGGGGPGSGPVSVKKHLSIFLPGKNIIQENYKYKLISRSKYSIGKIRSFYSNFLVVIKAYVYIYILGKDGSLKTGLIALLNSNYLYSILKDHFKFGSNEHVMHEFVISLTDLCNKYHFTVMDFAKRILDYGYHSPTVSFPLIIKDCLMIEPTETESKKTLDEFAEILIKIKKEAIEKTDLLKDSPVTTPVKRIDDVKAARFPILKYEN